MTAFAPRDRRVAEAAGRHGPERTGDGGVRWKGCRLARHHLSDGGQKRVAVAGDHANRGVAIAQDADETPVIEDCERSHVVFAHPMAGGRDREAAGHAD